MGWPPVALVDNSLERLEVVARKAGRARLTTSRDWRDISHAFDAAIVALPHRLHGSVGIALADAGKPVFMEAPLALTAADLKQMIAAAKASGTIVSVGLYCRHLQSTCWTKALLQSGLLGEIRRFDVSEGTIFRSDASFDVVLQPNVAAGGVLTDVGVHALDLLQVWLGDVESMDYRDDSRGGFEADCVIDCHLKSGATGTVTLSRTRALRNAIRIEGTQGFVDVHAYENRIIDGSANALAFVHEGISSSTMRPQFLAELFAAGLMDFKSSLSAAKPSMISAQDAAPSAAMVERCYASRGRLLEPWEKISEDPSSPRLPSGSKALVTGATGFVGGRLVERLVANGVEVRCAIRNVGRAARLARLPVELLEFDLGDAAAVQSALEGIDYVFHCAHEAGERDSNLAGLRNVLSASSTHPPRRLVYVSTFAVYEPFSDGLLTEESPDGDRSNVYVDTKLDMERMIFAAARDGIPATIIQPAIVYGPFCRPWTNTPAERLLSGDVILPDQGEGTCNAVYIDDLVDGLLLAATASAAAAVGERFIISGPQPVTWADFYNGIARALGANPPTYWPRDQIVEANGNIARSFFGAAANPKRLIKSLVRWPPLRKALQKGFDVLPDAMQTRVKAKYLAKRGSAEAETHLPSRQALALYVAKPVTGSEKARAKLGYTPRFDFERGMALTGDYLRWAYTAARVGAKR